MHTHSLTLAHTYTHTHFHTLTHSLTYSLTHTHSLTHPLRVLAGRQGGKDGSRRAFAAANVPFPDGTPLATSVDELVHEIAALLVRHPGTQRVVVKLNEGFSGEGNAVLHVGAITSNSDLISRQLPDSSTSSTSSTTSSSCADGPTRRTASLPKSTRAAVTAERPCIGKSHQQEQPHHQQYQQHVATSPREDGSVSPALCAAVLAALRNDDPANPNHTMAFCSSAERWQTYRSKIAVFGAIAELFVENAATSPSVQCVIDSEGAVEVLSTHEQVLQGQVYKGCMFPARREYGRKLVTYGKRVAEFLAEQGVVDNLGIDFLCVPKGDGEWEVWALEINLRLCGTTHPFMTLKLLAGGHLDSSTGLYVTQSGKNRFYVASDNFQHEALRTLTAADLLDISREQGLLFDHDKQTGIVFHLLGCLSEWGKIGITAIGDTRQAATDIFEAAKDTLVQVCLSCVCMCVRVCMCACVCVCLCA